MPRMTAMLLLVGLFLTGGCASVRVTTDLKPEADPTLKSPAGKFYVAGLKYTYDYNGQPPELDAGYGRRLLSAVRKECVTRYPLLFAQDSANSIPLWMEVSDTITSHDGKMAAWMLGTAMLAFLIFPGPVQIDRDIDVTVGLWNGRDGMGSGTVRKDFRREQHGWGSMLTPLGLITIPGESDFPKVSEAFNMGMFMHDDVPQVAQQVATAIAKLIAAKDPASWTTSVQGQGDSGVLQAPPPASPPPTESAAPF